MKCHVYVTALYSILNEVSCLCNRTIPTRCIMAARETEQAVRMLCMMMTISPLVRIPPSQYKLASERLASTALCLVQHRMTFVCKVRAVDLSRHVNGDGTTAL